MSFTPIITDDAVLEKIGQRIARMRLERNLTQEELAMQSGVSRPTVERLEAGKSTQLVNFLRICRTLGILERLEYLLPDAVPSPIQQLKQQGKQRQRASRKEPPAQQPPSTWTWGDEP